MLKRERQNACFQICSSAVDTSNNKRKLTQNLATEVQTRMSLDNFPKFVTIHVGESHEAHVLSSPHLVDPIVMRMEPGDENVLLHLRAQANVILDDVKSRESNWTVPSEIRVPAGVSWVKKRKAFMACRQAETPEKKGQWRTLRPKTNTSAEFERVADRARRFMAGEQISDSELEEASPAASRHSCSSGSPPKTA